MSNALRYASRILVILGLVALVVGAIGFVLVRRSFPQVDGEIQAIGLTRSVDVYRDEFGVAHLYAENNHDLLFAQGYVHAQERFWQMDVWRHIGSGRVSELLGSSELETDAFLRTLGWEDLAQQEFEASSPETQDQLLAYATGVNAYLAEREGAEISFEYAILKLLNWNYEPAPWEPVHSITFAKVMAWDLRQNLETEIDRALLLLRMTPEEVDFLYPPYPNAHPVVVPGSGVLGPTSQQSELVAGIEPLLNVLAGRIRGVDELVGEQGPALGSNNWVVSGDRTQSGSPLLVNDPHLGIAMPSIWYEMGLHCSTVGLACDLDVAGFTFAGVPGVIVGHNQDIAWGVTTFRQDSMDLFIEQINPDNPNQYWYDGRWEDMEVRTEQLRAPGRDPTELVVRSTRHGPIISDVYDPLDDLADRSGISLPDEYAISLSWTALQPAGIVDAIGGLNRASNWAEFREALSGFDIAGQNFVYADVEGNIGYQATGLVPIRAGGDGRLPVAGWTGENEWTGFIPWDEMPRTFNPPAGFIATANNAAVTGEYPYQIADWWSYGYRAGRIVELLDDAGSQLSVSDMQNIQSDTRDTFAPVLIPHFLELRPESDAGREAQTLLAQWSNLDRSASGLSWQMNDAHPGAVVYGAVWRNLLILAVNDDLGGEFLAVGGGRWFEIMRQMLAEPDHPWWDNRFTETVEGRDAILERTLEEAMQELVELLGGSPNSWRWTNLHTATFRNQTLGESGIAPIEWLFNRGAFGTPGGPSIINATWWDASEGYDVIAIPSMRMVVDLGNFDRSTSINSTGQSGHAFAENYIDLAEDWAANQQHSMLWSRGEVESAAVHHLVLTPP